MEWAAGGVASIMDVFRVTRGGIMEGAHTERRVVWPQYAAAFIKKRLEANVQAATHGTMSGFRVF